MPKNSTKHKAVFDWLTTVAIAAIAISLTVAFHEGMHAFACVLGGGGDLQEYSALHVACIDSSLLHGKIVSGAASVANIILFLTRYLL